MTFSDKKNNLQICECFVFHEKEYKLLIIRMLQKQAQFSGG